MNRTGAERGHYSVAGLETTNDHQFDLAGPRATEVEACQSARELAVVCSPPLEIRRVSPIASFLQCLSRLLVVLSYTALATLSAVFLWEMNYQRTRHSPAIVVRRNR